MTDDLRNKIKQRTDDELSEVYINAEDYQPEFIELVELELLERGISLDILKEKRNEIRNRNPDSDENFPSPESRILKKIAITMRKMFTYFKRIYRLAINFKKQEEIVWKELKELHQEADFRYGIFEKEKCIETLFNIDEDKVTTYYYIIQDGYYHCRVIVLDNFPTELTTDLFILSAHFNNLLRNGVVIVNVNSNYVEYHIKSEILIPLLYKGEIYHQLHNHYLTSKDIYRAFHRLVVEREAPAIIIADLMKENEEKNKNRPEDKE